MHATNSVGALSCLVLNQEAAIHGCKKKREMDPHHKSNIHPKKNTPLILASDTSSHLQQYPKEHMSTKTATQDNDAKKE
jgi:hypothetical protein